MASELFKEASKYFSLDALDKDNWAFKLFSKVTVGIFMGSAALSLASSYSGDAIVCKDEGKYVQQYCWLHGSRHLSTTPVSDDINNKGHKQGKCYADKDDPSPDTEYYIWVSMLLFLNGLVFMIPDKLWQYFEDGMLEQFGSDKRNFLDNPEDKGPDGKHVAVFKNISKKLSRKYFWTFVACEMLNVIIGVISFLFINAFLSGHFSTYGADVLNYNSGYKDENTNTKDPMCSLFPTIVNCETSFFGITGAKEDRSNICILGQNILNQKIYFVLWLWFMILFGVSVLVIINRIMCIFVPAFQRQVVASHLKSRNSNRLTSLERIPLGHDYLGKWFILAQLGRNSSPYKYRNFLDQLGEQQPLLVNGGEDRQA